MPKSDILHTRIDPEVKVSAEKTLKKLGLSTADAINIFMRQVVLKQGLPFDVKLPMYNKETLAAMEDARIISKTGKGYKDTDSLFKGLDE